MNTTSSSAEWVIAGLRRQLLEAEETLRAIREGEGDALVVRGLSSEEVFTIESADSYRDFMEAMEPGAAALDASGRVLYANTTLTRLLGTPVGELQGKLLQSVFDTNTNSVVDKLLAEAATAPHSREIRFEGGNSVLHFVVSAKPLRLGTVKGFAVTFAEVTSRVRAEAAERSERVARAIISSANEAVLVCDTDGVITHVNAAAKALSNGQLVGMPFATAVPLTFTATGVMGAQEAVQMAISGAPLRGLEVVAP